MNNRATLKILIVLLLAVSLRATACVMASSEQLSSKPASEEKRQADPTLKELAAYKSWNLVNPQPVKMDEQVAMMCAPLFPRRIANPHAEKFLSVYVNEAGRHAMLSERWPKFPQGSLIVKEKLDGKASPTPELLTAMLKRESGYDPKNGDWEYFVLDGTATKIVERGQLESCQSCHTARKNTDYIFRIYLPAKVQSQLK